MANGSSRVLPVILSLIVGFAVGWLVGRSAGPHPVPKPVLAPRDHWIRIGPKANEVSEPVAEISQSRDHRVVWTAKQPSDTLTIVFKATDFPSDANHEPPFVGPNNKDLKIRCDPSNPFCNPGEINRNLPKLKNDQQHQQLRYKYWQILDGPNGHDEADGMIIIDP